MNLIAVGGSPSDARDIRSADADIGKLAIAQAGKLAQALVVTFPLLDKADDCSKHGVLLSFSSGRLPGYDFRVKIGMFRRMKSNNVALQLGRKCIAKMAKKQHKICLLHGPAANLGLFDCGDAKRPL